MREERVITENVMNNDESEKTEQLITVQTENNLKERTTEQTEKQFPEESIKTENAVDVTVSELSELGEGIPKASKINGNEKLVAEKKTEEKILSEDKNSTQECTKEKRKENSGCA